MDMNFPKLLAILAACAIVAIVYVYFIEPALFGTTITSLVSQTGLTELLPANLA